MPEDFATISIRRDDAIAEIALQRPERKNAITGPMVEELSRAVATLRADDACHVLLIAGGGGAFCSGLDLKEFNAEPAPAWRAEFQAGWRSLHEQLYELDKPVVCALERYAINAGSALALSADFLIAGETAFLQVGEVMQGRPAPMNLAWLRLRFGDALTRQVTLLGRRIPGPELLRLGIAFECAEDATVLDRARALAAEIAALPPAGMAATKTALRRLDLPGGPNAWFRAAASAVSGGSERGPLTSVKR